MLLLYNFSDTPPKIGQLKTNRVPDVPARYQQKYKNWSLLFYPSENNIYIKIFFFERDSMTFLREISKVLFTCCGTPLARRRRKFGVLNTFYIDFTSFPKRFWVVFGEVLKIFSRDGSIFYFFSRSFFFCIWLGPAELRHKNHKSVPKPGGRYW